MQYLLMIYSAENSGPAPGSPEFGEMMQAYFKFGDEMEQRGLMLGGNPLEPVSTASTVRVRNQEIEISDGPFAETKEILGGYYLLDCKDMAEALECAAKIPTAAYGSIEVRPIMDLSKLNPA